MLISEENLDDLLRAALERLFAEGKSVAEATKGPNIEVNGVLLELRNPRSRLSWTESKGTLFSCLGELVWYLSGSDLGAVIDYYIPRYSSKSSDDNGYSIHGAYGPRLMAMRQQHNQVLNIIDLLKRKRHTRRAVIQLFNAEDIVIPAGFERDRKDIPCTCTLQFLLRDNSLHMLAHMRSNDVYIGLPHDIFSFTMLQEIIATSLGAEVGYYKHMVGSLHLYDANADSAKAYLSEGWPANRPMPPMPNGDPWGDINTVIEQAESIRNGVVSPPITSPLPAYWADLVSLLLFFHKTRQETLDLEGAEHIADSSGLELFQPFISRRLERAKQIYGGVGAD